MHALGWQILVTVFGLLVGAFYLSSQTSGFPSQLRSARFAREISFSTVIAIYTYVVSNGSFYFDHAVEWIKNCKILEFCFPVFPYIMILGLFLVTVNDVLNSVFCKLGSKKRNVIILSVLTVAINIAALIHILGLQISTATPCKIQ